MIGMTAFLVVKKYADFLSITSPLIHANQSPSDQGVSVMALYAEGYKDGHDSVTAWSSQARHASKSCSLDLYFLEKYEKCSIMKGLLHQVW